MRGRERGKWRQCKEREHRQKGGERGKVARLRDRKGWGKWEKLEEIGNTCDCLLLSIGDHCHLMASICHMPLIGKG